MKVESLHIYKEKERIVSFLLFSNLKIGIKKVPNGGSEDNIYPLSLREYRELTEKWINAIRTKHIKGYTLKGNILHSKEQVYEDRFNDLMRNGRILL